MLAGVSIREESLQATLSHFQHLLPGSKTKKYSLQELATIQYYIQKTIPQEQSIHEQKTKKLIQSSWRLPFHHDMLLTKQHKKKSEEDIRAEFRRLDILGEGRLTYLIVKSALELADVNESEERVRDWLRRYDRGGKGHVDIDDYFAIYHNLQQLQTEENIDNTTTISSGLFGTKKYSNTSTLSSSNQLSQMSLQRQQRIQAIRSAFDKYDVDGDGLISVQDLHRSLGQGEKALSLEECEAWIRRRDRTGNGALTFEDFAFFYL
jgi:Ca2+-binding EF-hand superfamily protein